jgi:hypothetical protein
MKLAIILAVLLSAQFVCASPTEISPLPAPTTAVANQSRTTLKHRKRPFLYGAIHASVPNILISPISIVGRPAAFAQAKADVVGRTVLMKIMPRLLHAVSDYVAGSLLLSAPNLSGFADAAVAPVWVLR